MAFRSCETAHHLIASRAIDTQETVKARVAPHAQSRHEDKGHVQLVHSGTSNEFGQGSLFAPHITAGMITEMREYVAAQWRKFKKYGIKDQIVYIKEASKTNRGHRLTVKFNKYGLKEIGSYIDQYNAITVFPEETSGSSFLTLKGVKKRKYRK